jgi:NADH dehydrogenase
MKIFITGATGFVGGHVLKRLLAAGHNVLALVRDPQQTKLSAASQLKLIQGDVTDGTGLNEGMKGCDAVIHLVGIIVEAGKNTFERVHHIGTRNAVEAARRNGIARFVQMSALGVRADGVSEYQTSKWKGEEAVRQSGIPYCILRPSLIFGPGDGFVTQMLETMRKSPLFRPVPGDGTPKFRPVFVEDVAACFTQALTNPAATNQAIDLGGADELSLNDVLAEIARCVGIRKPPIHIPLFLMFMGAAAVQTVLPRPPVTVGQLKMLREGSTCEIQTMVQTFGIKPVGFREGLRRYLCSNPNES